MPTSPDQQFAFLAFSSLFSVINPISAAPIFVAMTSDSPALRRRAAFRACLAAAAGLAGFAAAAGAPLALFRGPVAPVSVARGGVFAGALGGDAPNRREEGAGGGGEGPL